MKLKILSWNVWGGRRLDEVIEFLRHAEADVIFLQEVIEDDREGNTALTIAHALGYQGCAFAIDMDIPSAYTGPLRAKNEIIKFGNAIISSYEIVKRGRYDLSPEQSRTVSGAEIRAGDTVLHAFSVHLKHLHVRGSYPEIEARQKTQTDALRALASRERTIVAGDFNTVPGTYPIEKMREAFENAEAGSATPTWAVYKEGCRCAPSSVQYKFDYIFATKDLSPRSFEVAQSKASDHLPVFSFIIV